MWIELIIDFINDLLDITFRPLFSWYGSSWLPWLYTIIAIGCIVGYWNSQSG